MRVALLTYGTRGDVQPFIALARGLQQAGHTATLAAPERMAALAAPDAIPFVPLAGDPAQFMQALIDKAGRNPLRIMQVMGDFVFPLAGQVIAGLRTACRDADVIVHTFLTTTGGHAIARERNRPDVSVQFFPVFAPTGEFPSPAFPDLPLGRRYNHLTHALFTQLYWRVGHLGYDWLKRTNPAFPRRLAWPFQPSDRAITPLLFAFSPAVVARTPEWGTHVHLTGFWTSTGPAAWQPPQPLAQFLEAGPPPICVNFGSMVSREAQRLYEAVLAALSGTQQRGVIVTGLGGWQSAGDAANVLVIDAAPHDWLFPRMKAVIHHGGAGTTAAALQAGVPNIVVPFAADQPFWGQRVAQLRAGPQPIPAWQVNAARLTTAIHEALDNPALQQRAAEVGRQLRTENGVGQAIALIEAHCRRFGERPASSPPK